MNSYPSLPKYLVLRTYLLLFNERLNEYGFELRSYFLIGLATYVSLIKKIPDIPISLSSLE